MGAAVVSSVQRRGSGPVGRCRCAPSARSGRRGRAAARSASIRAGARCAVVVVRRRASRFCRCRLRGFTPRTRQSLVDAMANRPDDVRPARDARFAALVSFLSASRRRCSHLSMGSTAAARSRRSCAWRSFCRLVLRAWAMSSHEAPSRRAASIQKISARWAHQTACRTLRRASSGIWGPLAGSVRARTALPAHCLANVPSIVLMASLPCLAGSSTAVVVKGEHRALRGGRAGLSSAFVRRGNPTPLLIRGCISGKRAHSGPKVDPHAVAAAGGRDHTSRQRWR